VKVLVVSRWSDIDIPAIIKQYCEDGLTTKDIAAKHKVSQYTIASILRESEVSLHPRGHRRCLSTLTEYQLEVLYGELLGDGSLDMQKSYTNARFQWGGNSEDHGLLIHKVLGDFACYFKVQKRLGHKDTWKIVSKSAAAFTPIHREWYFTGRQAIPNSIKLTPVIVRHWYLGDGYLKKRPNKRPCIILCSQNYGLNDWDILIREFNRIGLNPWTEKNNKGYVLRFSTRETNNFFDFIGECPVPYYKYKWLTEEEYNSMECNFSENDRRFRRSVLL